MCSISSPTKYIKIKASVSGFVGTSKNNIVRTTTSLNIRWIYIPLSLLTFLEVVLGFSTYEFSYPFSIFIES